MERIAIDEEWGGYGGWHAIDRYKPCFELASGGMGTVFLARVTARAALHRFVALKRIHPHLVKEPGFIEMFLDEAHVASRIVHPNVCSVFDFDAQGGRPYIAMEYLMGEPLTRVTQSVSRIESPAAVARACRLSARIIADACEGLHAAHELRDAQGELLDVVHRDVSPQNLILTYDGAIKIVDFGLVRMAQCLHKTKTGVVKGKFGYLAPEAVAMKSLDRRADVWGLGVVLWELLTGQRLFRRDTEVDTVMAVAQAEIPAPSTVRAGIPPEIDGIVLRALARNANERYPTARSLGRDLVHFVHAGPEPIGLSDIAEWTEQLFPGGRARKLELLEIAGHMLNERSERPPAASVRAALPPPPPEISESAVPTTYRPSVRSPPPPAPEVSDAVPTTSCCPRDPTPCATSVCAPARRTRWTTAMAASMAAVLAIVGGIAFAKRRGGSEGASPPEAARPSPSAEVWASLVRSSVLPEAPAGAECMSVASHRSADTSGALERDSVVIELVPEGEGEKRRILVRAVPHAARRP